MVIKTKYVCRECGNRFAVIKYNYFNICWRCRQKRAQLDSTKSMKYMTDENIYKTNKDKVQKFKEDARKDWEHISHLDNKEQELILWMAVIDSFERKFGKLEDENKDGVK